MDPKGTCIDSCYHNYHNASYDNCDKNCMCPIHAILTLFFSFFPIAVNANLIINMEINKII